MGQSASVPFPGLGGGLGGQLIKAVKTGDADAVTELVSSHPQLLRYSNLRQLGCLHYAARGHHVEVLQQLVAKAQEVEHLQWQEAAASCVKVHALLFGMPAPQRQALQHRDGEQSLVKQLVNAASDRGVTPLMLAVDSGCVASIKLLLEQGADPWAVDKLGARTALHYAARADNPEVIQLLVEAAGSSGPVHFPNRPNTSYVDVRTQSGFTAAHFAVQYNSQQVLAALLNQGANPLLSTLFDCLDIINCPKGTTALHLAARHGNEAIVKQVLRAYVEQWFHRHLPDPRLLLDGDSLLPCQVAARRAHADLARMLLPSNPIHALFGADDPSLLGPPTLAAIAGAVLRNRLTGDLHALVQQQQGQEEGVQDGPQEAVGVEAATTAQAAPAAPAAPAVPEVEVVERESTCGAASASSSGSLGDVVCGVCFDTLPTVQLAPCGHSLCTGCCQHLLDMNSRCVMMCPFCRGGVAQLAPLGRAAAAAAAAQPFCVGSAAAAVAGAAAPAMALSSGLQLVA